MAKSRLTSKKRLQIGNRFNIDAQYISVKSSFDHVAALNRCFFRSKGLYSSKSIAELDAVVDMASRNVRNAIDLLYIRRTHAAMKLHMLVLANNRKRVFQAWKHCLSLGFNNIVEYVISANMMLKWCIDHEDQYATQLYSGMKSDVKMAKELVAGAENAIRDVIKSDADELRLWKGD